MLAKGALVGSKSKDEVNGKEEMRGLSAHGSLKISAKEKGSREAGVVAQAVLALRSIVQQHPVEQEEVKHYFQLVSAHIINSLFMHPNLLLIVSWIRSLSGEVDAFRNHNGSAHETFVENIMKILEVLGFEMLVLV